MNFQSLLKVKVDFATSHLIFPHIIEVILALLLIAIVMVRWRQIAAAVSGGPIWPLGIDHARFFGTIAGTIVYFLAMPEVGDQFPNTGLGFLFCSIPYVLGLSLLYLRDRISRHLIYAALNAVIAPTIVWYVMSNLFNISLP